ncbi:hypothetical protein ANN_07707 [Periplaneta americana]|uniref:Uncharacterized protein n=1 Tax=Periplaneta americana TaxID=6978 RepID=A0ABQ8T0W2_PERAM|nr:hypothetical protein ANN_07707 [Periplaneta americana]
MQHLGAALTFLQWYHDDSDEFLDRIVTGDETWISHFTPEPKQQSMHWRHSGSPVRTKFKQTLSVRKVMCTVFWDRKGILLIDFLPRGETVNADRYCETLRKLRRAIQNKRRGMLTAGVVLLNDNARPHTARRTAAVLTEFGRELFDHPPYSPDLAPSDFHVFLHLKKFLSSMLTCYGTKIVLQWLKEGKLVINKISQLGPMDPSTNSRKQFDPDNSEDLPVLEYQHQQGRLLPHLAATFALRNFANYCYKILGDFLIRATMGEKSAEFADLGMEIHVVSSAAKPIFGWIARDVTQECYEACGDHSYLKAAGLGDLRNHSEANCTYEGENNVLLQQTSNWLLTQWNKTVKDESTFSTPLGSAKYLNDADKILRTRFHARTKEEAVSPEVLLSAYQWLVCWLLQATANKVQSLLQRGKDAFTAKNDSQMFYAKPLSLAFIEHFILQKFWLCVTADGLDPQLKAVLTNLCSLYGAWSLEKYLVTLYQGSYISGHEPAQLIREGILDLFTKLKPDAIALADVLAPPDFALNSVLGKSDGKVYENLQAFLFQSPQVFERPSWWQDVVYWHERSKL